MSVRTYTTTDKSWTDIDFKVTKANIKKLQKRIAKAYQEGYIGKVNALQHRLIHSKEGKALAIHTVTTNKGKFTPGIDGVLWITPEEKWAAISTLRRRGYVPKPLRRVYITKPDGRKRPLSIPTMRDRAMQTLYKLTLEPIAEVTADTHSYGFRAGRSTRDAIERCVNVLSGNPNNCWILEGDIKACFDNISHEWILENIPIDKPTLRKFLKSGFIERRNLNPTDRGIPQGSSISTVICNMVLDGLEKEVTEDSNTYFIRYADDFIIVGTSKKFLNQSIKPKIHKFLAKRGLKLSTEKTQITHIKDGFDFLGWNVRRDRKQILIVPSKRNHYSILDKISKVIRDNCNATQEQLCYALEQRVVGWIQYHKSIITNAALRQAEKDIFSCVWDVSKDYRLVEHIRSFFSEL